MRKPRIGIVPNDKHVEYIKYLEKELSRINREKSKIEVKLSQMKSFLRDYGNHSTDKYLINVSIRSRDMVYKKDMTALLSKKQLKSITISKVNKFLRITKRK